MSSANGKAETSRNYFVDSLKIIGTFLVVLAHVSMSFIKDQYPTTVLKDGALADSYIFGVFGRVFGIDGYFNICMFTFLAGYWLVNTFKKYQRQGVLGRGRDHEIIFKYWAQNFASYMPYNMWGVMFGFVGISAVFPSLWKNNPLSILNQFLYTLPQALGFIQVYNYSAGGTAVTTSNVFRATDALTNYNGAMIDWNMALWYMSVLICFAFLTFAALVKSETFGLLVWTPAHFVLFCSVFSVHDVGVMPINLAHYLRMVGPMALGIWGWYITDYLKKMEKTKKTKIIFTILSVTSFALFIYWIVTAFWGYLGPEIPMMILISIAFSESDYFTVGINRFLSKFRISKHFAGIALCAYLHHSPIIQGISCYMQKYPDGNIFQNFSNAQFLFLVLGACVVLYIPFYFIDKKLLKRLGAFVLKITKAKEPVVIPANECAAAQAGK